MTPESQVHARDHGTRLHNVIRAVWITAVALVGIGGLGAGAILVTASPSVCGMCHEMAPKVDAWRTSGHSRVGCPECHETPRPSFEFPETLGARATNLIRDLNAHFSPKAAGASLLSADATATIPDAICLHCHVPEREVTMRLGTLINGTFIKHREHAARNKSCVSCHLRTGHPGPEAERPLMLMRQCFNCHGRSSTAKAPGTCDTCHPKSFDRRPASHAKSTWATTHGKTAKADRKLCPVCHEASFCKACHGLDMPHPAGWENGRASHGPVATQDRRVCAKCHQQAPNFCSMCHHKEYEPANGPWLVLHPATVKQRGASFCLRCHDPMYCVRCHTTGRVADGR